MEKNFLEAGEIVSTHGIQGEVKILPWADSPEFLLKFKEFYIDGKAFWSYNKKGEKYVSD